MVTVGQWLLIPVGWIVPAAQQLHRVIGVRPDFREVISQLEHFGYRSIGIVCAAGIAVGGIVAVHSAVYVSNYSAGDLAGWAVGYATLREVGPLLTGLLLAGRVGAMNAAELADMQVRGQIRGLEALGLDPLPIIVAPRVWAAFIAGLALFSLAAVTSLATAVFGVITISGLRLMPFLYSLHDGIELNYLFIGQAKAGLFALIVGLLSTHYGMLAKSGSSSVGAAVNSAAVASAVGIVTANFALTWVW
jgi:phospholipid/cholesterol/gamma-HCH transport system permease protein